jgi:hypothetical protein
MTLHQRYTLSPNPNSQPRGGQLRKYASISFTEFLRVCAHLQKKSKYQKSLAGFSAKRHYLTLKQTLFRMITSPPDLVPCTLQQQTNLPATGAENQRKKE